MDELAIRLGMDPALAETLRLGLLGRLLLAAVLGGIIGLERELADKPAGLRTNLLICVGAALLMEVSVVVASMAQGSAMPSAARGTVGDPGRIAAQIVSGIGFLGAGTILQSKGSVTGLTTAATIWVVAAIGMAVGAGAYVEAVGSTILVGMSLVLLARLEVRVIRSATPGHYVIRLDGSADVLEEVQGSFRDRDLVVQSESLQRSADGFEVTITATGGERRHREVARRLASLDGVRRVTRVPA